MSEVKKKKDTVCNQIGTFRYFQDNTGRLLRQIFMYLPSKKDYPDYYKVITDPIDLSTIEAKIKNNKVCVQFDGNEVNINMLI